MILCDICKKEKKCTKMNLVYTYACKAFQTKEYDICRECATVLDNRRAVTTIAFIQNKTELETLKELHLYMPLHEE